MSYQMPYILPIGYIYITLCIPTHKIYIGQKKSPIFIETYHGSGTLISKIIKELGEKNFRTTVIKWCYSQDELDELEKYWIEELESTNPDIGYNISEGGINVIQKSIPIIQLDFTGEIIYEYKSITEASKESGISISILSKIINEKDIEIINDSIWLKKEKYFQIEDYIDDFIQEYLLSCEKPKNKRNRRNRSEFNSL